MNKLPCKGHPSVYAQFPDKLRMFCASIVITHLNGSGTLQHKFISSSVDTSDKPAMREYSLNYSKIKSKPALIDRKSSQVAISTDA